MISCYNLQKVQQNLTKQKLYHYNQDEILTMANKPLIFKMDMFKVIPFAESSNPSGL